MTNGPGDMTAQMPRTITILNVDDDTISRYTVTHLLKHQGYAVTEAGGGQEALRLARRNPDVILLDVNMPDMDGFEVCRHLKADPQTARIPVLYLSATSTATDSYVTGLDYGADAYLTQPVEAPVLLATVRALLRMRRAEDGLRQAALEWQATLDSLRDGVCLIDEFGLVRRCNSALASILGKAPEETVGRHYRQAVPPAADLFDGDVIGALHRPLTPEEVDIGGRGFLATADVVRDEAGQLAGAVLALSDITERKRTERFREEYISLISHDLRSPLTSIIGQAGLLLRTVDREGKTKEARAAEAILASAQRMNNMIQELVEATHLESGLMQIRKEPTDLASLIAQLVERVGDPADRARIHLELPETEVSVEADYERVERAVTNLLSNALKYSPPDKPVPVRLERHANHALITVTDYGSGIAPENLPRLFQRYHRVGVSSDHEGLGLGLYITRLIAEAHGGSAWAESETGKGSAFHVALPIG